MILATFHLQPTKVIAIYCFQPMKVLAAGISCNQREFLRPIVAAKGNCCLLPVIDKSLLASFVCNQGEPQQSARDLPVCCQQPMKDFAVYCLQPMRTCCLQKMRDLACNQWELAAYCRQQMRDLSAWGLRLMRDLATLLSETNETLPKSPISCIRIEERMLCGGAREGGRWIFNLLHATKPRAAAAFSLIMKSKSWPCLILFFPFIYVYA